MHQENMQSPLVNACFTDINLEGYIYINSRYKQSMRSTTNPKGTYQYKGLGFF